MLPSHSPMATFPIKTNSGQGSSVSYMWILMQFQGPKINIIQVLNQIHNRVGFLCLCFGIVMVLSSKQQLGPKLTWPLMQTEVQIPFPDTLSPHHWSENVWATSHENSWQLCTHRLTLGTGVKVGWDLECLSFLFGKHLKKKKTKSVSK